MKHRGASISVLIMLILCVSSAFAARTVIVKQDGSGDAATIAAAIALTTPNSGDTIDIQQWTADFNEPAFTLDGVSLICSAATTTSKPTIARTGGGGVAGAFVYVNKDARLENLNFRGRGATFPGEAGVLAHAATFAMNNCMVSDVTANALWLGQLSTATPVGPLKATITNCILITQGGYAISTASVSPANETKPSVLVDHCTLICKTSAFVFHIDATCIENGCDGSEFTLKNSIVQSNFGRGIVEDINVNAPTPLPAFAMNHSHNAFIGNWVAYYTFDADKNGVGLDVSPYTDDITLPSVDSVAPDQFVDQAHGDFSPKVYSPLNGAGENGSTIGAVQTGYTKPVGTVIVRQDGMGGALTTISGAIAAVANGTNGIIEIQQFSAPFVETTDVGVGWRSMICTATDGQGNPLRAEIRLTGSTVTNGIDVGNSLMIDHGKLANLKLVGRGKYANGWQQGVQAFGEVTIDNCEVTGFNNFGISYGASGANDACVIKNTYVYPGGGSDMDAGCINIAQKGGGVTIDHCTLVGSGDTTFAGIRFANELVAPYTGSDVTIKNTIVTNCPRAIGAYGLTNLAVVEHHNDLNSSWEKIKYDGDNGTGTPNATDLSVDPLFTNEANSDYSLKPSSTLRQKGENNSTIGAYNMPVPNAAKDWMIFN